MDLCALFCSVAAAVLGVCKFEKDGKRSGRQELMIFLRGLVAGLLSFLGMSEAE